MGELQKRINAISKNGILDLEYGEFNEQIVINKPITIKSDYSPITIVSDKSPCLRINSDSVVLQNLIIQSNTKSGFSISVKGKTNPVFKDVYIYGDVEGILGEEGKWDIPRSVELAFSNLNHNENEIIIFSPTNAKIYIKDNQLVKIKSDRIKKGINKIVLEIDEIFANNIINGEIIIESEGSGLKRRISFNGNTFENNVNSNANKILWECKESKAKINKDLLAKFNLAYEGESYEHKWLTDELNCDDYHVTVGGLPDGLKFTIFQSELKIYGIPRTKGVFNLKFTFEKNEKKTILESKFIVEPKKILPLIIDDIVDRIKLFENTMFNQKIHVISSNSLNVKFKFSKSENKELHINENTGEIFGEFKKHGIYNFTINVSDGFNSLNKDISFTIIPKEELKLKNSSFISTYEGEYFESEIQIENSDNILYQISSQTPLQQGIELVRKGEQYYICGKINKIGIFKITLLIEDIYERNISQEMTLECKVKPKYSIEWLSDSQIDISGIKYSEFKTSIKAKIKESPHEIIHYKLKDDYGDMVQLGRKGDLKIFLNSMNIFSITIIAICKFGEFEKKFNVSVNIRSKSVLSIEKEKITSQLFANNSIQTASNENLMEKSKSIPLFNNELFQNVSISETDDKKNSTGFDLDIGDKKENNKNDVINLWNKLNTDKKEYTSGTYKSFICSGECSETESQVINIKDKLVDGYKGEFYSDYIFNQSYKNENNNIIVRGLPIGLEFDDKENRIHGYPKLTGDYKIEIEISNKKLTTKLKINLKKTKNNENIGNGIKNSILSDLFNLTDIRKND